MPTPTARFSLLHLIDCAARPRSPKGLCPLSHRQSDGTLQLDFSEIELRRPKDDGRVRTLREFLPYVTHERPLNANVLDFLLRTPLPSRCPMYEWADGPVFFAGTLYERPDGTPVIRYLRVENGVLSEGHADVDAPLPPGASVACLRAK